FGEGIALDDNTIFLTDPWLYTGGSNGPALYVYNRPPGGWADTTEDAWYYDTNPGTSLLQSQVSLDGDYVYFSGYESVRVFKKDNPASWTSLTPHASIKPDDIENSARFGFDLTAKNGRVLISAPGSSTFSSNSFIRIQNPKVFEFNLPPSGWDNPTSDYTSIIEYMPVTGAGSYFGIAVDIEGDYAVVGSSRDQDNGVYSGSAYVLKFDGLNWQRIAELTPSDGQPYDNFGLDVSISGDFIAVNSVYSDRYDENGNRISYTTGAVYVFRKPVGGWTDMNESYKVTLDDLNLKSFGRSVAIDMPYLVVGQYEDRSSEDLGTVHVFKFTGDAWIKQATLLPKVPGPGDGFGCEVAIEDSVIVVGARSSRFWFQESNRVFIYQQPEGGWKDTTESAILYPSDVGIDGYLVGRMFGFAVDIQGDEIIVGCPGWIGNEPALGNPTNLFRGAAYIYKKPESGWVGLIKEQAILKPEIEIPYHNFGYSVKIEERYAVAGAPQNIIYTYGGQNPGPGKVYFFQKPESGWISKSPDKIIIGDESDPSMTDYFGSAVTSTFGYLFVGAFADDNSTGVPMRALFMFIPSIPSLNKHVLLCAKKMSRLH
ncbi:MAG: FG-GAP repeat protein, partial [Cyclobacteriaceae bacterium]|nr:FG-GAP repeat protein [Cyclobacteriaceae bacterium]